MCIPNLFFKWRVPNKVPEGMLPVIETLKRCRTKEECLKKAYGILTAKYRGYKFLTYVRFWDTFHCNLNYWWKRSGFMECTNFSYLLRVLLIKSGHFTEKEIVPKLTSVYYISLHQYLKVHVGREKWIDVDCWGKAYGIKLGQYAHGFNC